MSSLFEACRRHAEHFGAVLRSANTCYLGADAPLDGLALFDRERANIEAAWRWVFENAEDPRATELCAEFPNFGPYILSMRLPARIWQVWINSGLSASRRCGAKRTQVSHLALPILTFMGSMAALYGAGLVAWFYGGMGPSMFIARLHDAVSVTHLRSV